MEPTVQEIEERFLFIVNRMMDLETTMRKQKCGVLTDFFEIASWNGGLLYWVFDDLD